jgi:organic radical activating enzyme
MKTVNSKDEQSKRSLLREEKPHVYEKVMNFDDKLKRGESIAIIQFQYNYTCNFTCVHCSVKHFQGRNPRRSLNIGDVRSLAKQADEMGLARFVITGGEPLIFKEPFEEHRRGQGSIEPGQPGCRGTRRFPESKGIARTGDESR